MSDQKLASGAKAFVITPHTEPDRLHRQQFTMEWDGFNPVSGAAMRRGQVFFAVIREYVERITARGDQVTVLSAVSGVAK